MNDLEKYFNANKKRLIHKWQHYFDIYDRHFSRYKGKNVVMLEIGIFHGGSLQMWKNYFGKGSRIYGIDINPECKKFEEKNIEIFIGSQSDRNFLREIKQKIPKVDILIDDGGHTMKQQIVTFEELYDHVKEDGVFLCEDLHTSYWPNYSGGVRRRGTFIEYSKNFIDQLNAYHSKQRSFRVNDFTKTTNSIHYYDSMVVLEKKSHPNPVEVSTGTPSYEMKGADRSFTYVLKRGSLIAIDYVLRFLNLPGLLR